MKKEHADGGKPLLPAKGERPVFGKHRLTRAEAETAPAWQPLVPEEGTQPDLERKRIAAEMRQHRRL